MTKQKTEGGVSKQLEASLSDIFLKKLPGIPANIKELIVKYGPWLALVGLIFSLPTLLAALGFGALVSVPGYAGYHYGGYSLIWLISIASMVLVAIALPGLFKRKISAWRLMFYSSLISAVYSLVTMSLGSLIIGTGISMYILFQIKSYYK